MKLKRLSRIIIAFLFMVFLFTIPEGVGVEGSDIYDDIYYEEMAKYEASLEDADSSQKNDPENADDLGDIWDEDGVLMGKLPDPDLMKAKLVTDPYRTPTYSRMMKDIKKLKKQYPALVNYRMIGKSAAGIDIPMVTLGVGPKKVLITASLHGREYVTTSQLMRSIDIYARAYAKGKKIDDINVRKVLNRKVTYCFVPMVNPDGVAIATGNANSKQEKLAIEAFGNRPYQNYKNLWKANARNVNLNRNFPVKWSDQEDFTVARGNIGYRGKKEASEPETKALMKLCKESNFSFLVTCHSRGEMVFWEDGHTGFIEGAQNLSQAISGELGYDLTLTSRENNGGRFEKWFRHEFNKPGIVIEFTSIYQDYHSANSNFNKAIWDRSKSLWLKLYKYA